MQIVYLIISAFSLPALAQISLKNDDAYFLHGGHRFRLNWSTLDDSAQKRVFSNKDFKTEIHTLLKSNAAKNADLKDDMSDVRNQGQRGTCSFFATMGLVEHFHNKNADYSEQCLAKIASDDDSDTILHALEHIIGREFIRNGVYIEQECPYRDPARYKEWGTANKTERKALEQRARNDLPTFDFIFTTRIYLDYKIEKVHVNERSANELIEHIRNKLSSGKPVGASIYVAGGKMWESGLIDKIPSQEEIEESCRSRSERLNPLAKIKECGSHAIVFTGFDDNRGVFYFKNSWDKTWGLDASYLPTDYLMEMTGYGAMSYEYFAKFRLNHLLTISHT